MTKAEAAVLRAARCWWKGHRPLSFTEADHVKAPTINAHYSPVTARLARAVARLVQEGLKR